MAGSAAYGSPSSCRAARAVFGGASPSAALEKNPSTTSDSTSSRVTSAESVPEMSFEPSLATESVCDFQRVPREQCLFRRARHLQQLRPLCGRELAQKLLFDAAGERGVHVVAAEHQVIADRDALHRRSFRQRLDLNEGEVGRASADVDDEHAAMAFERLGERVAVARREVVERGLRLFDQREVLQPRGARRRDRERPRDLIERGRDGDDDFLVCQGCLRVLCVPSARQMLEQLRRCLDGRQLGDIGGGAPGKNLRLAIHSRVTQPRLGRSNEPYARFRTEPTRELADRERAVELGIETRRQQRARRRLAGPHLLHHRKIAHGGLRAE